VFGSSLVARVYPNCHSNFLSRLFARYCNEFVHKPNVDSVRLSSDFCKFSLGVCKQRMQATSKHKSVFTNCSFVKGIMGYELCSMLEAFNSLVQSLKLQRIFVKGSSRGATL